MAGRTPLRTPIWRCQLASQSKLLKNRAIGVRLEGAPIPLDRRQILVDGQTNVAQNRGRRVDAEMRVKSCWDSLGHSRVSIVERSKKDYVQEACTIS